MNLPYGRRLVWYWLPWAQRRFALMRLRGAWILWVGQARIVFYAQRVSWADLDRKIERAYQRKRNR